MKEKEIKETELNIDDIVSANLVMYDNKGREITMYLSDMQFFMIRRVLDIRFIKNRALSLDDSAIEPFLRGDSALCLTKESSKKVSKALKEYNENHPREK